MARLVLGVGNLLMGDEGVGVHAIHALEPLCNTLPDDVFLLDGGTGGFHLLSHLQSADSVILIDAALDDHPPGTVTHLTPRYASDYPKGLSAHDIGLKDLIETAALLGYLPRVDLITVSIAEPQPMEVRLTPAVEAAVPEIVRRVVELVGRGVSVGS